MTEHHLSDAEMQHWQSEGFLIRRQVFTGEHLARLQQAVERAAAKAYDLVPDGKTYHLDGKRFVDINQMTVQFEHQPGSDTIKVIEPVHQLDSVLSELIDDPRITEPMQDLVGSESLALWTDKLNLKRPHEGSGFGWHQDSPYWMHDCQHLDQLPNVYIALDDATRENGCLRLIRGSHLQGCLPGTEDGSQLGGFYTSLNCFDPADEVLLEAPAGSLAFFNAHTIHGSEPNQSDQPRRALVLTYQPGGFPQLKSGQQREINLPRTETV